MNYCIVNDQNVIENIIVCENDEIAAEFHALPSYATAAIGGIYNPPPPPPTAIERLEAQAVYTAMMTDTLMEG